MDQTTSNKRKMAEADEPNVDLRSLDRGDDDNEEDEHGGDDEARKLEAKRAYNRLNAARARKRTKDQLADLCRKIEALTDKNETMQEKNEELMKRVAVLTEENNVLRRFLLDADAAAAAAAAANARPAMSQSYKMNPLSLGATLTGGNMNPAHKLTTLGSGAHPLVPPGVPMAATHSYAATVGKSLWDYQNPQSAMF